jgi:hypothetical protein
MLSQSQIRLAMALRKPERSDCRPMQGENGQGRHLQAMLDAERDVRQGTVLRERKPAKLKNPGTVRAKRVEQPDQLSQFVDGQYADTYRACVQALRQQGYVREANNTPVEAGPAVAYSARRESNAHKSFVHSHKEDMTKEELRDLRRQWREGQAASEAFNAEVDALIADLHQKHRV